MRKETAILARSYLDAAPPKNFCNSLVRSLLGVSYQIIDFHTMKVEKMLGRLITGAASETTARMIYSGLLEMPTAILHIMFEDELDHSGAATHNGSINNAKLDIQSGRISVHWNVEVEDLNGEGMLEYNFNFTCERDVVDGELKFSLMAWDQAGVDSNFITPEILDLDYPT